ncbi:MAG: ABC transporter ATP-binding protein/permease [Clostridia bacterium]|nr:ABC transporter ATP-binding protein/permease [Clostridia bacterium]
MKLVLKYLKNHIGIFLLSTLFLTLEATADLMQPTFMALIVDNGIQNADLGLIGKYGLIMLAIAAMGALSAVMRNHFASRTSQRIGKEIRHDMYSNVQSLSLENIDRLSPSSIITRITNDVNQIQDFINGLMRMMIKAPVTCIGAIILIIIQTPRQAPIMAIILVIVSILIFANMRVGYPLYGKVQEKLDRLNGVTREFLSAVRVVKAFRAEDEEVDKFNSASLELALSNTTVLRAMAIFTPLINLTVNFGIVILLWISQGQSAGEIGRLMASVNYMTQVLFAVTMIANIINIAVRAMASSERINEVLTETPAQKQPLNPLKPDIKGNILLEKVVFSYHDSSEKTLNDISIKINAGETIGIIGPTGSGKTTLVNLIPRFYDCTSGKITIDGADVNDIDEKVLRDSIAIVPQKALLFSGTIEDNLRWGKENADSAEIREAIETACADEFVDKMDLGINTVLGQGGVNLSGGQKQRLALARALIRKPRILILDDCTSALDAGTEAKVLAGIGNTGSSATVLLISQRISTVMRADKILCLDNGNVQGYGSHDELMRTCHTYQEIYKSQIGGDDYGK